MQKRNVYINMNMENGFSVLMAFLKKTKKRRKLIKTTVGVLIYRYLERYRVGKLSGPMRCPSKIWFWSNGIFVTKEAKDLLGIMKEVSKNKVHTLWMT